MGKGRKYAPLLGVGMVAVGVAVVFIPSREREPEYEGKRLSEWVDRYATGSFNPGESDGAVRHIGTNAVPFLLKWIQYETPGWKAAVYKLDPILQRLRPSWEPSHENERLAVRAVFGFKALGLEAKQAVPELDGLMNNPG